MNLSAQFPFYFNESAGNLSLRSPFGELTNTILLANNNDVSLSFKSLQPQHIKESDVIDVFPETFNPNINSESSVPLLDDDSPKDDRDESLDQSLNAITVSDSSRHTDRSHSKRKPRTVFSRSQLSRMKEAFTAKPYLTTDERKNLAIELKVTAEQIKVWFQNHRSKLKRQGRLMSSTNYDQMHHRSNLHQPVTHINALNNYSIPSHSLTTTLVTPSGTFVPNVPYANDQSFDYFNHPMYPVPDCYTSCQTGFYQNPGLQQANMVDSSLNGCVHPAASRMASNYINPVYFGQINHNNPNQTFRTANVIPSPHQASYPKQQFQDSK